MFSCATSWRKTNRSSAEPILSDVRLVLRPPGAKGVSVWESVLLREFCAEFQLPEFPLQTPSGRVVSLQFVDYMAHQTLRASAGSRDLAGAHGLLKAKPLLRQLRLRHHIRPGFQFFDFPLELLQVTLPVPLSQRPDCALQQLGRQFLVFIHEHGRQKAASAFFQSKGHRAESLLLSDQEGIDESLCRRTSMQSLAAEGKMRLTRRLEVEVLAIAVAYRTTRSEEHT